MKAIVVTKYGGPEVMEMQDVAVPEPDAGEVLVRVRCIGLNFADIYGRFGAYPGTPKPPYVPGLEFAGDVVSLGTGTHKFRPGDRVMGYCRLGSHAEYVAVNQYYAAPVPAAMSYDEAASFIVSMLSAYHGLVRLANLQRGERLLVHAAAGGVGLASVQIARHLGATVFGTAGTAEKVELALRFGAHHVINYREHEFDKEILQLTNGAGVDVIMDSVGGEVYKKSWPLLAQMGRYMLFGMSSMTTDGALSRAKVVEAYELMKPVFPPGLIHANKGIIGFNLGLINGKEEYLEQATDQLVRWFTQGVVKPLVGKKFEFADIVEAHRYLQTRQSVGKVVVAVP